MRRALLVSLAVHLLVAAALLWWAFDGERRERPVPVRLTLQGRPPVEAPVAVPQTLPPVAPPTASPTRTGALSAPPVQSPPVPGGGGGDDAVSAGEAPPETGTGDPSPAPVETRATLLTPVQPAYPREARRRGWTGEVEVAVEVDGEGRWTGATVVRSSGHGLLDRAALEALKSARYLPATQDGVPRPGTLDAVVRFRLE